jgi:hypothetical protein
MVTKGFVSLEYILIFAGVLSVLTIIATGIISLYSRNINAIDNYRLKSSCKEINQTIELFELMPRGLTEIELNNLEEWAIERKGEKEITVKNKQKTCTISSRQTITSIDKLPKNHILKISKENNALNIN